MISVELIKELRASTGAGVSDVKRALEESGGDRAKAEAALEKKLGSSALKRAGRETQAGVVAAYIHANGKIGALVQVSCETDFVARTAEFIGMAHDIAMQIAAMEPADVAALLAQPFIKDQNKTAGGIINEAIGRFGENITIERFTRYGA